MKHTIHHFLLFFCIAIMAAFTPAHQTPDNNRLVPENTYQKPPVMALTLTTVDKVVAKNEEVCIAVSAKGFEKIMTMQYSMNWDADILKFKELKNFGLEGMDTRNFGQHLIDKGILTFSWYDQKLIGVTKKDDTVLYEMCFDPIGSPGSETRVEFTSKPTVVEISNAASLFLDLRTDLGKIKIVNGE